MAKHGIWKGYVSFGLLNIPVVLQTATEDKGLHFSLLDQRNLSPIRYRKFNAATNEEVPKDQIVKGYQFEKEHYVLVDENDLQAANPKATQTIDIEDFVDLDDVDPLLFEKPYYLVPQKGGEKGYFLLRDALRRTNKSAIGKIVIRTKQHLVAIFSRGDYLILEILRFSHEIIEVNEADFLADQDANYSDRELHMAEALINGMTAEWSPKKYKDTYYDDLMKRIEAKISSGKSHVIAGPQKHEDRVRASNVTDLLPLLRKSLEQKTSKTSNRKRKVH